jgi:TPR repeat protein
VSGGGGKLIALAVAAGVCLALLLQKPAADTRTTPERTAPAPTPPTPDVAPTVAASPTAAPVAAPAPSASASITPDHAANVAPTVPRVPPPPEVASLAELKTAEIRCYQKDPDACFRAAAAYAAGRFVPADAERAENYRKVELTQLFRQCEKAAVRPCLVIAERYDRGEGLPRDTKKAQHLLKHVAQLCERRPAPACELLGTSLK